MTTNKIFSSVSDQVCAQCSQCWNGECRAFQIAHSVEEREQRQNDPVAKCMSKSQQISTVVVAPKEC